MKKLLIMFFLFTNIVWAQTIVKPMFYFDVEDLVQRSQSGGFELRPDSVEIVERLAASDKVELVTTDNLKIFRNYPDVETMLSQLRTQLGGNQKLVYWWDDSDPNKQKIDGTQVANYHYARLNLTASDGKEAIFARAVHTYHNYLQDNAYISRNIDTPPWSDEYKEFVFNVGADAFDLSYKDEAFNLEWRVVGEGENASVECVNSFGEGESRQESVFENDVCKARLGFKYKWIDESEKNCGEYTNEDLFIQESMYLNCEPEHVQEFENYVRNMVNPVCSDIKLCLEKVTGEELGELTATVIEILSRSKVKDSRDQVYQDSEFDYRDELNSGLTELRQFSGFCNTVKSEQFLANFLTNNPEEKEPYERAIDEIDRSFATTFRSHAGMDSEVEIMLNEAKNGYNECLIERLENGRSRSSYELYFHERCLYDAHEQVIESYRRHLRSQYEGSDNDGFMIALRNETQRCNIEPVSGGGYNRGYTERTFDFRNDLNSCIEFIDRVASDIPGRIELTENASRELMLTSGMSDGERNSFRSSFAEELRTDIQRCRGFSNRENCEQKVYQENLYGAYLDQLQTRNTAVNDKIGNNLVLRNRVIETLVETPAVRDCFDRVNQEQEQASNCEKLIVDTVNDAQESTVLFGNNEEAIAAEAMTEDFQLITRTLTRDISTFHYNDSVHALGSSSVYAKARQYVFHVGPRLNNMIGQDGATMMGRGLYAASDPSATTDYGDELLEIPINAGENYIDLRGYDEGFPISYDTFQKLEAAGCHLDNYRQGIYASIDRSQSISREEYDRLMQELKDAHDQKMVELQQRYDKKLEEAGDNYSESSDARSWFYEQERELEGSYYDQSQAIRERYQNNGTYQNQISINHDLNEIKIRIHGDESPGGVYATVSKGVFEVFAACHEVFATAISNVDASMVAYDYDASPPAFCNRQDAREAAFVMIDTSFGGHRTYSQRDISKIVDRHQNENTPIPAEIRRILQARRGSTSSVLSEEERFSPEVIEYWRSRLFNCDATMEEDDYRGRR